VGSQAEPEPKASRRRLRRAYIEAIRDADHDRIEAAREALYGEASQQNKET